MRSLNGENEIIAIDEDAVFLFDDNIPSIPTRLSTSGYVGDIPEDELQSRVRRNKLLRLISDPKSYYSCLLEPQRRSRDNDLEDAVAESGEDKELDSRSKDDL
jgi:hypothetical protein